MMKLVISAPGKVILHGEHSVCYGKLAVAAAIDIRTTLQIEAVAQPVVHLTLPQVGLDRQLEMHYLSPLFAARGDYQPRQPRPCSPDLLGKLGGLLGSEDPDGLTKDQLAVVALLYLYIAIFPQPIPLRITVSSKVQANGLGSSAAYAVCLASGFLCCNRVVKMDGDWKPEERDLISNWAFTSEILLHGTPSGIDNSVATVGGLIGFRDGKVEPVPVRVPTGLRILLIDTRQPRNTKDMVELAASKYKKHPGAVQCIMTAMDHVAQQCLTLFKLWPSDSKQGFLMLEDLMDMNHCLLASIGVSHSALEQVRMVSNRHGLKAKMTGAGGGGCAYVLLPPYLASESIVALKRDLEEQGFSTHETEIAGAGVRLDGIERV